MSGSKLTERQKRLADSIYEAGTLEPRVLSQLVDDFVENLSEADFAGEWEKFCGDEPMPAEMVECPHCNGETAVWDDFREEVQTCPTCNGKGKVPDTGPTASPITAVSTSDQPKTDPRVEALIKAANGLKRIIEEIDGAMIHGTWRDDKGSRLKDTPEWISTYIALAKAQGQTS